MLAFICFLATLGVFIGLLNSAILEASEKSELFRAKLDAEKCSSIIDSFYANSGGGLLDLEIDCIMEEGEIVASQNGRKGKAAILNKKTKLLQLGNSPVIEVGVEKHYER